MIPNPASSPAPAADTVLVRGIHFNLTPALRGMAVEKSLRLLRHNLRIVRIRVDLELQHSSHDPDRCVATGRIEIRGRDLVARVVSDDMYKSIDLLVDRLDRMLCERTRTRTRRRNDRAPGTEFRDHLAVAIAD